MSDVMTVENTEMQIREYNGQRVVTFKDIDRVHQRSSGMAKKAFNRNKKRFIEGTDYFMLKQGEDCKSPRNGLLQYHYTYKGNYSINRNRISDDSKNLYR